MAKKKRTETELKYYRIIKEEIEELFKTRRKEIYLEVTADKFSNKIKDKIPKEREIIFSFLRKARPDLTGYVKEEIRPPFIVVEIKNREIDIDNVYQTQKYIDLFGAKFGFLISTVPIPTEIKRICRHPFHTLTTLTIYDVFSLGYFNEITKKIEWFPENPFEKDFLF